MEKRISQEAGISTFRATTVTELLAQMQKYVIEHAVKGETGVSISNTQLESFTNTADYTSSTIKVTKSDGTSTHFVVYAKRGENGADGNSITAIQTQGHEETSPNYTTTKIKISMSDNTSAVFTAFARHGERGPQGFWSFFGEVTSRIELNGSNIELQLDLPFELSRINGISGNVCADLGIIPPTDVIDYRQSSKFIITGSFSYKKDILNNMTNSIINLSAVPLNPTSMEGTLYFTSMINPNILTNDYDNKLRIIINLFDRDGKMLDTSRFAYSTLIDYKSLLSIDLNEQ